MVNNAVNTEVQRSNDSNSNLRLLIPIDANTASGEYMNWLWQRIATQDYAFDDYSRGNPQMFINGLLDYNSIHWAIEESGYIVARNVRKGGSCDLHFVIWDRQYPFPKAIQAGKEALDHLFNISGVERVTGPVPTHNHQAKRFATLLRFKYEGSMRRAELYKGIYYDVDIFGILKSEFQRS
jgi:RimJ/RimL family protein N-acetyltransferase